MARLSTLARFEVSGEILSEDTIALLTAVECKLPGAEMDSGEFAAAWDLLSDEWQRIRQDIREYDTERLRKRWILPLLDLLGHNPQFLRSHPAYADGRTIPLTHRSADISMWLLDYSQLPDEKLTAGRRRNSPHELFQEYLDLTEDDWGIICNGRTIRLLHDYHKTLTRNYVEADLESIFEALDIDAFRAVWRIFRADSFKPESKGVRPIEKLCEKSRQEGAEIGKELRKQVLEAIRTLGNGFLAADQTGELREALISNPEAPTLFYQALLRIVYRLLFLLYIENKPGWTPSANPVWASSYSISRLREQAEQVTSTRADGEDHWEGLKVIFGIIRDGNAFFNIHPYGGELFDDGKLWRLDQSCLRNSDLLNAIRLLTFFEDKKKKVSFRVNFRTIRIDALGSVYEALLDVAPAITPEGVFTFAEGTERKLTGSYYTPPELVAELIKSALVPVIEDRLKDATTKEAQEAALLAIKVIDPACGSGAFLVQALDKLAEQLCLIRKEGEEPSELDIREARRDVVTHCIHGVDLNPMAVELCKFTLWLHVAHPRLPLSYLEPRIKCGNALIGVPLKKQVEAAKAKIEKEKAEAIKRGDRKAIAKLQYIGWPDSLPDEAFDPVTGDDKAEAKRIKERNKKEREQAAQMSMDDEWLRIGRLADWFQTIHQMPEATIADVRKKSEEYGKFVQSQAYEPAKAAADTWCAAFFWPLDEAHEIAPTTKRYREVEKNPHHGDYNMMQTVKRLSGLARFFHWEIEFPVVFSQGGFDCVLGNPPWDILQDDGIGKPRDLSRVQKWYERGTYTILNGRRDLYKLFLIRSNSITNMSGSTSLVTPVGWLFEEDCIALRQELFIRGSVTRIIHIQNTMKAFFGEVDTRYRFCVVSVHPTPGRDHEYTYVKRSVQALRETRAVRVSNSGLIEALGQRLEAVLYPDSEYRDLHERLRLQLFEIPQIEYRVVAEFHASTDKSLITQSRITQSDWGLLQNRSIHFFNHLFAPTEKFIREADVLARITRKGLGIREFAGEGLRLVFRDIARNDDSRTLISCLIPAGFVSSYDTPMVVPIGCTGSDLREKLVFACGYLASFVADFLIRPYVDKHLKGYVLARIPIPFPNRHVEFNRVLELTSRLYNEQLSGIAISEDVYDEHRAELDVLIARISGLNCDELDVILGTFDAYSNEDIRLYGYYRTRRLVLEAWARLEAELGPVVPVNYREMLEQQTKSLSELASKPKPALKVAEEESEYLVLVPPDYTPQEKLALDEPARIEDI